MEEEIKYGNKLIAEYMGGLYKEDLPYTFIKTGWINTPANHNRTIAQIYDFKYHSDWNWLMPVCKKIIESYFDKRQDIYAGLTEVDLKKTFLAVVKFIEFWNDPNQPKLTWTNKK